MAIPKDARITLDAEEMPRRWYNLAADMLDLAPPLNPSTREPVKPEDFKPIFCNAIVEQEGSKKRFVDIPEEGQPGVPEQAGTIAEGLPSGEDPEDTCKDLLQKGRHEPPR